MRLVQDDVVPYRISIASSWTIMSLEWDDIIGGSGQLYYKPGGCATSAC